MVFLTESELGSSTSEVVAAVAKQPPAADDGASSNESAEGLAYGWSWSSGGRELPPVTTATYIYIHNFGRGRISTDLHDDHPNPPVNE